MPKTHRNDRDYVRRRDALRRKTKRNGGVCHLCKKPFDWTLHWKHPMAFTADHVDAVGTGGHMLGALEPAHRSCNSRRGKKKLEPSAAPTPRTTRKW